MKIDVIINVISAINNNLLSNISFPNIKTDDPIDAKEYESDAIIIYTDDFHYNLQNNKVIIRVNQIMF